MFEVAAFIVAVAALMVTYRAVIGPTVFDRVLSINVIGSKAIILLILIGFVYNRPHFLDIALVYALMNFIATIAFLKFIEKGKL
ncbi:MAG: monovalent cation/H+ antiporter complex subunit F [bacterium]|nr:monovalent cation/H+ antiporter complex subunit F [bacterium]